MQNTAKGNIPLTISDFALVNTGASLVFSTMLQQVNPPDWSESDSDEMGLCQKEFFLKYHAEIASIPLIEVVRSSDCIGFMEIEDAANWLPVWLCGAIFASDVLGDRTLMITHYAQSTLERCLAAKKICASVEAISYFVKNVCDPREDEPNLYALLDEFTNNE